MLALFFDNLGEQVPEMIKQSYPHYQHLCFLQDIPRCEPQEMIWTTLTHTNITADQHIYYFFQLYQIMYPQPKKYIPATAYHLHKCTNVHWHSTVLQHGSTLPQLFASR